ncbi:MAG TPA: hypothetical protein VFN70_00460 [Burkholderiales bacterium]|nr:hypothetical protein [Burkholderiales bacterium]
MPDETLDRIEQDIAVLEAAARERGALGEVLEPAIALVARTLRARLDLEGKPAPADGADVLEIWRALVKGDPTWNAIRDNCRELVFYRNCLALGRTDALPPAPHRMAVRTARHIFLYVRSRAQRDAGAPR